MAYIKERGNNNFLVRVSHGTMENGRAFQKSRLFHLRQNIFSSAIYLFQLLLYVCFFQIKHLLMPAYPYGI